MCSTTDNEGAAVGESGDAVVIEFYSTDSDSTSEAFYRVIEVCVS